MSPLGKKVLIAAAVVVVAVVGGPWVYINVIKDDAPVALTLDTVPTTIGAASDTTVVASASGVDGEWVATSESVVGYRVREILFGQSTEGVGRTNSVTGSLVVSESVVTTASFTVEMATLVSDSDRRDRQVAGRILDVSRYPTSTFELLEPITLTTESLNGSELAVTAKGTLTLRGVSKDVSVPLVAQLVDGTISVNGTIEIVFADWGIPDPSVSAISVEDRGLLEFLIVFGR